MYDVLVIGGGPAGLTAATYACRAGKRVLVVEKNAFGGQITWSPRVENFPGYLSITGTELGDKLLEQAMEQGSEVELEEVTHLSTVDGGWEAVCESGASFAAKTVILAAGAKPRAMGVEREEELVGSGVCYCAVCDGAFYAGKPVAVCGGGNSALQDALLLSEMCSKVYLVHRRDSFRGEQKLVEALQARENVEFVLNAQVEAVLGEEEVSGLLLTKDGSKRKLTVDGVFVAIGHKPDLGAFAQYLALNEQGYAASDESCQTPTPGLFVAGDCRQKQVRQLTTAAADGATAALAAVSYLDAAR